MAEITVYVTDSPAWTGHSGWVQSYIFPALGYSHIFISDKGPADLGLGGGGNNIAGQLVVAFRLNVATMILIEVAYLIHKVNGCSHVLGESDGNITNVASIAVRFIDGVIVLDVAFLDGIHDKEQRNGQRDEQYGHDDVEDNGFFECCLP